MVPLVLPLTTCTLNASNLNQHQRTIDVGAQQTDAQILREEIRSRLEGWCTRYGWNPKNDTVQNRSAWTEATQIEYKLFLAYRKIARELSIEISGVEIENDPQYLYFAHEEGDRTIWKMGLSAKPYQRGGQLQTGNATTVVVEFCTSHPWPKKQARKLDSVVLMFTENRWTKARSKEWRNLPQSYVEHLIKVVMTHAEDILKDGLPALTRRYKQPPKKGSCPRQLQPKL